MPRQLRVEYPVAISHVMSRGVRKTDICVDDVERQDFLKSLVENLPQDRFPGHAYCLMRDHGDRPDSLPNGPAPLGQLEEPG
jgi:putative transposase